MSKFANHVALFVDATKDIARLDGINRAFARHSGLELQMVRSQVGLASLDRAAAESARTAPSPGSDKTPEQHAAEQARMHAVSQWWLCCFYQTSSNDVRDDDEWHSVEAVRAAVSNFDGRKRA